MHGSRTTLIVAAVAGCMLAGCVVQQAPPQRQQPQSAQTSALQPAPARAAAPAPATRPAVAPVAALQHQQSPPPALRPAPPAAPAAATGDRKYTIRPGDNLWNISKQFYGDGTKYERIINANPGLNPDSMKPGTQIVIP